MRDKIIFYAAYVLLCVNVLWLTENATRTVKEFENSLVIAYMTLWSGFLSAIGVSFVSLLLKDNLNKNKIDYKRLKTTATILVVIVILIEIVFQGFEKGLIATIISTPLVFCTYIIIKKINIIRTLFWV